MRDPLIKMCERMLGERPGSFRARKYATAVYVAIISFAIGIYAGGLL